MTGVFREVNPQVVDYQSMPSQPPINSIALTTQLPRKSFRRFDVSSANATARSQLPNDIRRCLRVGHFDGKICSESVVLGAGMERNEIDGDASEELGEFRALFFPGILPSKFPCHIGIELDGNSHALGDHQMFVQAIFSFNDSPVLQLTSRNLRFFSPI